MVIYKNAGKVLGTKVAYTYYKERFEVNFIVFIEKK